FTVADHDPRYIDDEQHQAQHRSVFEPRHPLEYLAKKSKVVAVGLDIQCENKKYEVEGGKDRVKNEPVPVHGVRVYKVAEVKGKSKKPSRQKPGSAALHFLYLRKLPVEPALVDESIVGSALDDAAILDHDDLIRVLDRTQPVGDHDGGPVFHQVIQRVLHELLR